MKPDIVVDIGNSRIKWGWVVSQVIGEMASFPHNDVVGWNRQLSEWRLHGFVKWAVAGVHPNQMARFREWLDSQKSEVIEITTAGLLVIEDRLGIELAIDEPEQVGVDRLLTAWAARYRTPRLTSSVVITIGTAATVDFVDPQGRYVGGAILPGPQMMARALHEYTAKLPRIAIHPAPPAFVYGTKTEKAIELGIASAILGAADQLVWDWAADCRVPPKVFITGGDRELFRDFIFTAKTSGIEIDPKLTLEGIRLAAEAMA